MTNITTKSFIRVQTRFCGFHYWEGAPEEVAFLRNKHRHIFHVRVTIPVTHSDHDLEFFLVKQQVDVVIKALYSEYADGLDIIELDSRSCEMMSEEIGRALLHTYPQVQQLVVSVSEDDENFGIVELTRRFENTEMITFRRGESEL